MTDKRKTTQAKPDGGISITGGVKGTGNVVGHGSQSHVSLGGRAGKRGKTPRRTPSPERMMWVRVGAFLLALIGVLAAFVLFARLQQGMDTLTIVELVLAALVAALGISGTIKPEGVAELLGKMVGKG